MTKQLSHKVNYKKGLGKNGTGKKKQRTKNEPQKVTDKKETEN
jgi:hypothetical protein